MKNKKILNYLAIAFMISFSFLIFSLIYEHQLPKIVEEINNSSIGAILTAIITVFLLGQQTNSEEVKERNSSVFEKKLQLYENFIEKLRAIVKDKKITTGDKYNPEDEIQELIFELSLLKFHTSTEGLNQIFDKIGQIIKLTPSLPNTNNESDKEMDESVEYQEDDQYYNKLTAYVFKIIEIMRMELYPELNNKDDHNGDEKPYNSPDFNSLKSVINTTVFATKKIHQQNWIKNTSDETMGVINKILEIINRVSDKKYELSYNKSYIGLTCDEVTNNFVSFVKRSKGIRVKIKKSIEDKYTHEFRIEEICRINKGKTDVYSEREGKFRLTLDEDSIKDIKNNIDLENLIRNSYEENKGAGVRITTSIE